MSDNKIIYPSSNDEHRGAIASPDASGYDFSFLTLNVYCISGDYSSTYSWWLSKTNNQPSVDSLFSFLVYLPQIDSYLEGGTLSSLQLESHYHKLFQGLHSHAKMPIVEELMTKLENDSRLFPFEFDQSSHHTDIEKFAVQISQDMCQQYDRENKVRIPYHPNNDDLEMGFCEYLICPQFSTQAQVPFGNTNFFGVVDVNQECVFVQES